MCFSCNCLFVLSVLVFVIFLFLLVSGLAAVEIRFPSLPFCNNDVHWYPNIAIEMDLTCQMISTTVRRPKSICC